MSVNRLLSTLNERRKPPMSNNYRELTGREKQRIKKLVTSLCANYDKEYGCHWTVTVQCWGSVLPTAHYADISASLSCRKMQGWKPYSHKHRPLIANSAASRSQLTENGCTARSAVPKKLAVSRPQHGCVSTGKNSNRCNAFALGKPCAARLFEGISALAGC